MTTMEKGDPKMPRFNRAGKTIIVRGITLGAMQALALAAACAGESGGGQDHQFDGRL
jgi:hypothetical protein